MSLINVFLQPSRAVIGVDTESINYATGEFIASSKMLHLPHANVVIAGRGTQGFLLLIFCAASSFAGGKDFDAISKLMPEAFNEADSTIRKSIPVGIDASIYDSQEIVLVGWSASASRMRAVCYAKDGPDSRLTVTEVEQPGFIIPWDDSWGEPPEGEDRRAMGCLASEQAKNVKKESPQTPMGGRLLISELTQHGMSFASHCDLPMSSSARAVPVTFSFEELQQAAAGHANGIVADKVQRARLG